ncbi:MAG: hypothetical protein JWN52_8189 [Actinomycetia bacterium]|nr:hypothetical protein [Actinomycetes bacterium]
MPDLEGLLGYLPANAQQLLDNASSDVDRVLFCATYDATNATVIAALKAATIQQVAYQLEIGNDRGIRREAPAGVPSGGNAGGVNLSHNGGAAGGSTAGLPILGDQAWAALMLAGLTGQGPIPV